MRWLILFSALWVAWVVGELVLYLVSCLSSWLRKRDSLSRSSLSYWSSTTSSATRTSRYAIRTPPSPSGTYPEES